MTRLLFMTRCCTQGATRDKRDGYRSLRCMRDLEAGMVITVEPGCYFNDYILDAALADESKVRSMRLALGCCFA